MKILAIDPSSTCTGYAVLGSVRSGKHPYAPPMIDAGLLKPAKDTMPALMRIASMDDDLRRLLCEYRPTVGVIEICSGGSGTGARHHAGGRLAVYGMAAGWMACTLRHPPIPVRSYTVDEQTWTGEVSKADRQEMIAALYPEYRRMLAKDPGKDVSDAIGIGLWYLHHHVWKTTEREAVAV